MRRPLMVEPRILVFSSLFPSAAAPESGTFIRERMFRVGAHVSITVVAPQPWSPLDWLVRLGRRTFRPRAPTHERMQDFDVYRPRFLSFPGVLKRHDGRRMARGCRAVVRRIAASFRPNLVDAHFLYPDGWAASRIAREMGLPLTITLRGSKDEWLIGTDREPFLKEAMDAAVHLFAVSEALRQNVAVRLGVDPAKVTVVGNGVDLEKFGPVDRAEARRRLGVPRDARVLIGVGGLIERKGYHRVIPLLKGLRARIPGLLYLVVGGGATQGDMGPQLERLARDEGVADIVRLCGPQLPEELKWFYGAADVFALATAHEGWANVFLEAMACGLPVITTRVGGNAQVVCDPALGTLVDWWDPDAFARALEEAMNRSWDRAAIRAHAASNGWDQRVGVLVEEFRRIVNGGARGGAESP
jgi:glycosyltransferase involved in cell wall biosynthesis